SNRGTCQGFFVSHEQVLCYRPGTNVRELQVECNHICCVKMSDICSRSQPSAIAVHDSIEKQHRKRGVDDEYGRSTPHQCGAGQRCMGRGAAETTRRWK